MSFMEMAAISSTVLRSRAAPHFTISIYFLVDSVISEDVLSIQLIFGRIEPTDSNQS